MMWDVLCAPFLLSGVPLLGFGSWELGKDEGFES